MISAASKPQIRRVSIAHLALLAPWVALVIDAWGSIRDNSFLWHVRAGTVQLDQGSVITTDPFSFTRYGEGWLTQSWLAELLYGWAERQSGLGFVPPMLLIASSLTFFGIGLVAYLKSRSVTATAFVLTLSVLALISFLVPRPVLFSFFFMTLVVAAWEFRPVRWTLPFLFWIWASVHGSFIIGLSYIGLSLLMGREWRELPKAALSGLVTLGTAHGVGVVEFLLELGASNEALGYLTEWRRPHLLDPVAIPFWGGLIFIVVGAFRGQVEPKHLWMIAPFALLGFTSVRAIAPAWLGLVPLIALSLSGLEIGTKTGLRTPLAFVFTAFVGFFPFLLADDGRLSTGRFPVDAVSHLDESPVFHDDVTGGYLIWSQGPDRRVYIDDRAELYGDRMREFVEVRSGHEDWKPVFDRDNIGQALLANEEELVGDLVSAGWDLVYSDESFTLLRR